jgi:phenylacetic acid degradation operon negative regulatory protein
MPGSTDHVQNEKAFLLRLLLIHDYRRLLLRDPGLPLSLLPEGWPGQSARQVCAELYASLSVPCETYLGEHLQLADGRLTENQSMFKNRFGIC